ncbi:DUF3343 domain-containing protein [bacterium]|nr:DUF3343 domain-containing protein [bacterium]MBU1428153.1 DUF3343 domain-containing protein [bacterium]
MKGNYSVVIFYSTSAAIRAESLAKKDELIVKLIPVPRNLSSDCGICLRFNNEDKPKIEKILQDGKVEYENIYGI